MAEEEKIVEQPEGEVKENTTPEEENKEPETQDTPEDKEEKSEGDKDDIKPEDVDLNDTKAVSEALNKKGLDYDKYAEEYMATGAISETSMKELEAIGISPEMVENYMKGYEARVEVERNELAQCVGGKETFDEIINWAAHNLKKDEIISLNSIRDRFQLEATLIGLKTKMEDKEGKNPQYQKGTGDSIAISGYRSQAEMFEAIKNPKYQKDEAYRADVQKKIAASREAGIDLGIY